MAKYDKYKQLYLSNNIIKGQRTTTGNAFGKPTNSGQGNEALELVEWINERIESGDIDMSGIPALGTNLGAYFDGFGQLVVTSSTGADLTMPQASFSTDGVLSREDWVTFDALVTLSGAPRQSTDLGTFTGSIIPDGSSIKEALQALETSLGSISGSVTGNLTSSSAPIVVTGGTNAVLGSGTQLSLNPSLILLSTLGGSLSLNQLSVTGVASGQLLRFNGSSWENWTPNYTSIVSGGVGDMLYYNGSAYVPITPRKVVQSVSSGNLITIPHTPIANAPIDVFYNGVLQEEDVDFTRLGNSFTFTSIVFKPNDKVTVKYFN